MEEGDLWESQDLHKRIPFICSFCKVNDPLTLDTMNFALLYMYNFEEKTLQSLAIAIFLVLLRFAMLYNDSGQASLTVRKPL